MNGCRREYVYEVWRVSNITTTFTDTEQLMTLEYQKNYENNLLSKQFVFSLNATLDCACVERLIEIGDTIIFEATTKSIRAIIDKDGRFKMAKYH